MKAVLPAVLAILFAGTAHAGEPLAERDLLERELAHELAPVKSMSDLEGLIASGIEKTPLHALSTGAQVRFLQSLVFTENGLASFYYEDMQRELDATEAYRILSLFGAQNSTRAIPGIRIASKSDELIMTPAADGGDHVGYLCHSRATCMESPSFICTLNC